MLSWTEAVKKLLHIAICTKIQPHRASETLILEEWENTLQALSVFWEKGHPKFPAPMQKQVTALLKRIKGKLAAIVGKLKHKIIIVFVSAYLLIL